MAGRRRLGEQRADAEDHEVRRAEPLHDVEGDDRGRERGGHTQRRGDHMHERAQLQAGHRGQPDAAAVGHAAVDEVQHRWTRDHEQRQGGGAEGRSEASEGTQRR